MQGGTWLALGCPPSQQQQDWLNSSETTTVCRRRRVQPLDWAARMHHHLRETQLQAKKKREKLTRLRP